MGMCLGQILLFGGGIWGQTLFSMGKTWIETIDSLDKLGHTSICIGKSGKSSQVHLLYKHGRKSVVSYSPSLPPRKVMFDAPNNQMPYLRQLAQEVNLWLGIILLQTFTRIFHAFSRSRTVRSVSGGNLSFESNRHWLNNRSVPSRESPNFLREAF